MLAFYKFHQLIDVSDLRREDSKPRRSRYKMNFLGMGEGGVVLNFSNRFVQWLLWGHQIVLDINHLFPYPSIPSECSWPWSASELAFAVCTSSTIICVSWAILSQTCSPEHKIMSERENCGEVKKWILSEIRKAQNIKLYSLAEQ